MTEIVPVRHEAVFEALQGRSDRGVGAQCGAECPGAVRVVFGVEFVEPRAFECFESGPAEFGEDDFDLAVRPAARSAQHKAHCLGPVESSTACRS